MNRKMPGSSLMTGPLVLKPCTYYVVRYAGNLLRGDGVNIGVLLHAPEEKFLGCLFPADYRWLRRIDPRADVEFLNQLQDDFESQIEMSESNYDGYLRTLIESLSNTIQLDGPRACLAENASEALEDLYSRCVGRGLARVTAEDTRLGIKRRVTAVFVHAGVWQYLEKRVPADRWTKPGDPFTFDYGYRPNGGVHFIHALSLRRDTQLAKTLAYTLDCVRRHEAASLTAVVDEFAAPREQVALASESILQEAGIGLQPVASVAELAALIRSELRLI